VISGSLPSGLELGHTSEMSSKKPNFGKFRKRSTLAQRLLDAKTDTESSISDQGRNEVGLETPLKKRARGVYLLPNLFTTASLFGGFFAIVQAMNGKFEIAAIAIFVSMILDSLDGRVARWTNTQSAFGEQYDSLSDMVSFGVAPALVVYEWSLRGLGKLGWVAAFVYCAGAALRLARFNTNIGVVDKRYFQGLPSPAAAALVAGFVWIVTDLRAEKWINQTPQQLVWVAWALTIYAGVSMVTNSPFYSFKDVNFKRRVPFIFAALMVAALLVVTADPPSVLFVLFVVYGLSGHILWLWRKARSAPN
jgi:CDP-diacylglycerol---serine O-phosphatidyltransferase